MKKKVTTRGKNNINIWLPVIISILIGQLRKIFKSKRPRSSSVLVVLLFKPTEMLHNISFFPKEFLNNNRKGVSM